MTEATHDASESEVWEEDQPPSALQAPVKGTSPVVSKRRRLGDLNNHRMRLANQLLWILGIIAVLLIFCVTFGPSRNESDIREVAAIIFPPLLTLAGTSFAWFYATRDRDDK